MADTRRRGATSWGGGTMKAREVTRLCWGYEGCSRLAWWAPVFRKQSAPCSSRRGVRVRLFEQRPVHTSSGAPRGEPRQLVCSNSLKSTKPDTAAGLLKSELDVMGSVLLDCPLAGRARSRRAAPRRRPRGLLPRSPRLVEEEPLIELVRERVCSIPEGPCVICAGPLCDDDELFSRTSRAVGGTRMSFFDAAAPIVDADS